MRCRCHSSCRRSRFSQLGTQIQGKRSSSNRSRISWASFRSVFCLRFRFVRISAASPIHNSKCNSTSSRSNQRACPLASIPTRTFIPWAADGCLMDIEANILFTVHEGAPFCRSMMLALITYSKGAPFYNAFSSTIETLCEWRLILVRHSPS
jgi:hypothetical protein